MTRYIDADAYKNHLEFYQWTLKKFYPNCRGLIARVISLVDDMETVDALPVRHAKWIPKITKIGGIDWPSGMKCSGCGEDALNAEGTDFLTDFCPHCGARMDSE